FRGLSIDCYCGRSKAQPKETTNAISLDLQAPGTSKCHSFGGTYLELTPHERIRHTDKFDDPPGVSRVEVVRRNKHLKSLLLRGREDAVHVFNRVVLRQALPHQRPSLPRFAQHLVLRIGEDHSCVASINFHRRFLTRTMNPKLANMQPRTSLHQTKKLLPIT